jgi:cell wall-associated NlpC family hydrolase
VSWSGRNAVRKGRVNEGITRCAPKRRLSIQLRSVVLTALAVLVLFVASVGISHSTPARADSAAVAMSATRKLRLSVWFWALKQRGKPYVWGGTGPSGYDCSGLVYAAYRARGIALPRTTYEMLDSSRLIRIRKSQAKRGDLAFFGTGHVELFGWGDRTFGAAAPGTVVGYHRMNSYWHPTMYFKVRMLASRHRCRLAALCRAGAGAGSVRCR